MTHPQTLGADLAGTALRPSARQPAPTAAPLPGAPPRPVPFSRWKAARARRVRRLAASRPAASSASRACTISAGSQRWALAVGMISAIGWRM